jgi:hypothetical protein
MPIKQDLKMTRRGVLAAAAASGTVRFIPQVTKSVSGKRIVTLYYDKALGAMRALDRLIP